MAFPTHIVNVLTPDRPGLVHALVARLADIGASVQGVNQSVMSNTFTITLATILPVYTDTKTLASTLSRAAGETADALVLALPSASDSKVQPASSAEIETKAKTEAEANAKAGENASRYILTGTASDADALRAITGAVADYGGNLVDVNAEQHDSIMRLVAEVDLPVGDDNLGNLQDTLAELAAEVPGRTIRLQQERLFAATNDVTFRAALPLLGGSPR